MEQTIHLYNTLTRSKEAFQPIHDNQVGLYACGPTVYNYAHIGNLRTYIFEDILRRTLEFRGYNVHHAMNITDVGHLVGDGDDGEDKMEVGARREGKHPLEIAKQYEAKFFEDFQALNCRMPQSIVRATDAIEAQIELIKRLEEKGFTYQTGSAIYFDTSKLEDYGKLTGQKLEEKLVGAREEVIVSSDKRRPQDFALWFFLTGRYKNHILHWSSPWGEGFPGWHIECSAISRQVLGQPFDIHTGGVDHIGTHHTNEIAQSEAAFGAPLANYWLHGEHLMVEGRRMGKSEGNLFLLADLAERGFSPEDFRYLVLTAHYRSKLNFTWASLEGAQKTLQGIRRVVAQGGVNPNAGEFKERIVAALFDDLDTPTAISLLHEAGDATLWQEFDAVLGLNANAAVGEREVSAEAQKLVQERDQARAARDWQRADELRSQIEALGYQVVDTPAGTHLE